MGRDHYPERMGFMAVINCPWYFPMFWSIVSSWIDPVTRSKVCYLCIILSLKTKPCHS